MDKYRKKPVTIEVVQFTGLNPTEIKDFVGENCEVEIYDNEVTPPVARIVIHTLEGDMKVSKGDYVIKGVNGEFYPCKPDIFEQTYESEEPDKELEKSVSDIGLIKAAEFGYNYGTTSFPDKSLEEEYKDYVENDPVYSKLVNGIVGLSIARHFAEWGAEQFAKIVRANLSEISNNAQSQFEQLYSEITGTKMYGGYND